MNITTLLVTFALALYGGVLLAQDKTEIDWEAEYRQLVASDPGVLKKIEAGQTTKEEVIVWMQRTRGGKSKIERSENAFQLKLAELVKSGSLSKEDAAKLAATMSAKVPKQKTAAKGEIDWDAEYEKLLSKPAFRKKIESGGASKEQVIEFLKKQAAAKRSKDKSEGRTKGKPGVRKGSVNFYAIVVGRLKSKDFELGELEIDIDYILSDASWAKEELVGQRIRVVGVAGPFLDNLLRIKRGETIKVRTGDYNRKNKILGFGYKFQVLERTPPFSPNEFGVPPSDFRGFHGELIGKVVEAQGYEVLLEVQASRASDKSTAKDAKCIENRRVRIAGFYNQHADAFADLHEGDKIRVSVAHRNPESDALNVTDELETIQ